MFFNYKFPFIKTLQHNYISLLFTLIIPGFYAPDFYLVIYFNKEIKNYSLTLAGIFINRLFGFFIFLFFGLISILVLHSYFPLGHIFDITKSFNFFIVLVIIVILLLLGVLFIKKFWYEKVHSFKNIIIKVKTNISNNCRLFFRFIMLKLIWYLVSILGRVLIALLLGINIPILQLAGVIILVNFLISLPISVNGIGIREFGFIGLFSLFGIDNTVALTISMLDFSLFIIPTIIGAMNLLAIKSTKLSIFRPPSINLDEKNLD